ncbi:MAG: hypothetical protein SF028_14150 [Candidatus Sumerlaeia bacterium]|nr:hypothetical protein [Candidatus Sumerlaeia bacterium]
MSPSDAFREWIRVLRERFDLGERRVWAGALAALFLLGAGSRAGLWFELGWHPALRQEERTHGVSSHWFRTARLAAAGDWALEGAQPEVTPAMARLAPGPFWAELWRSRLPRGAPAVYLLSASFVWDRSATPYRWAAVAAGGAMAVLAALLAASFFGRGAGLLAGVLLAANGPLATASLRVGPWAWEALAALLALWLWRRARSRPDEPAEWLMLGAAAAFGVLLRPMFWWAPTLLALDVLLTKSRRPALGALLCAALPLVAAGGALTVRNARAGAPALPVVGSPALDLARAWNADSVAGPRWPSERLLLEAAGGSAARYASLAAGSAELRRSSPRVAHALAHHVAGARDEPADLSYDYVRRRSGWLRATTLSSDLSMVLLWTSLLALLLRSRLPAGLGAAVGVLALHGFLFTPFGEDRAPLHALACVLGAGAFAGAWERRHAAPGGPWLLLAGAWTVFALLRVDDHSRGPRLRYDDFARSAAVLSREGRRDAARFERADWAARVGYEEPFDLTARERWDVIEWNG